MSFGIKLKVWGDYACFTRPEMKVERVSYDVITPSAARGILEAIYWKPAIVWRIDKIHVLKPIRFISIRRNELEHKISVANAKSAMKNQEYEFQTFIEDERQQRAGLILKNVAYVIEAHFEMTEKAGKDDLTDAKPEKHLEIFKRRAGAGQCFNQPYLGTREFSANFALVEDKMPESELSEDQRNKDLGWMLYDIDFQRNMEARFFRAEMMNGVINVPPYEEIFT
ncbi:MAG: type I-C CRISPR-associated protein Cas5c [Candidatus Parvarchaeota archaeon]